MLCMMVQFPGVLPRHALIQKLWSALANLHSWLTFSSVVADAIAIIQNASMHKILTACLFILLSKCDD
jgi:hypothetical protein